MKAGIKTRKWNNPEGYRYLAPYANAVLLRFLIQTFTRTLPSLEHRRKNQLDDAGRSVVSNIEEGYKRPTTREYLNFLGYSQGSLEEIKGLFRQARQDNFLVSMPNSSLSVLGIDLREFKGTLGGIRGCSGGKPGKSGGKLEEYGRKTEEHGMRKEGYQGKLGKYGGSGGELGESQEKLGEFGEQLGESGGRLGEFKGALGEHRGALGDGREGSPLNIPLEILYPPLQSLKGSDLTFEMFLELCNKTDYLFRQLTVSLEQSIRKEDAMSPMERWRWNQMEAQHQKEEAFDKELQKIVKQKEIKGD